MSNKNRNLRLAQTVLVIDGGLIAACGPSGQHTQPMMSMKQMPIEV
jgi:hypothetical protein